MKNREQKAYMTVEMSFLMPVIFLIFMSIVVMFFYFHDKNILHGAAHETAVVGSMKIREKEAITEEELISFCRDRIKGKCILFSRPEVEVEVKTDEVNVDIFAKKRQYSVSVHKEAAVTEPEKKIRNIRRFEQ